MATVPLQVPLDDPANVGVSRPQALWLTIRKKPLGTIGGVIVLAGISPMGSATNLPGAVITRQEKTVMGSYYGTANTARDFPLYADLYLKGKLDLARLVSKTYRLEQINEAYADMLSGAVARGVIVF